MNARRGIATATLQSLGVAVLYFLAAKFGMSLAFATKQVTAVWPPTGVALVALLLLGLRATPGVYLGALLANATSGESLLTAAGIAVGNTAAIVVGVQGVKRWCGARLRLDRPAEVAVLMLWAAAISCTLSAGGGVVSLAWGGIVPWSAYWSVWWVWWVGDALGVLLFAPFLLAWLAPPRSPRPGRRLELALVLLALAMWSHLIFAGRIATPQQLPRLEYTVFPFVIWAALRLGPRGATSATLVISAFAIWGGTHGQGPFAGGDLDQRLVLLDSFMGVVTTTTLMLSAVVQQRQAAERELQAARDGLEERVRERTAELKAANTELTKKSEEVEAFVYIVSHDLRAPLVNLQGFSSELERSCRALEQALRALPLPGEVQQSVYGIIETDVAAALRFIGASTDKFQRLIDALLALSRQGREPYVEAPVDVQDLVAKTLDSLRQTIEKSGAHVEVGPLPKARGDVTALGQVLSNLIGNALSYLEPERPGLIEVGGEQRGVMACYWVKDNGAGIPPSALKRVFQVFQRFHPGRAQGEGMGLAIVKRVVERHGGAVRVESVEGVGTTFHWSVPALVEEPAA